jgi:hypothetical protein
MATTTPNYGWDVPTSTDYVKDGATAIETLGDDIDASLYSITSGKNVGHVLLANSTFSGATTASVNNVFSASFDNYVIQISNVVPATFGNLALRMRVSGTDNASTNYTQGRIFVGSVGSSGQSSTNNSTANEFIVVQIPTGLDNSQATVTVTNPFTALRTGYTSLGSGNLLDISGGNMTVTTSYTGFTLINTSGGNIAGTVRVYGLRNTA